MTMEQQIEVFERRPAAVNPAEQNRRARMQRHFSAINRFEGLVPTSTDERLFDLLASGKINECEYLELCIADAQ